MAKSKVNPAVIERNLRLTGEIIKYMLNNPKVLDVLPENDPELRQLNLDLLDKYGSQGKPIVFARIKANKITARSRPNIFVPVAA